MQCLSVRGSGRSENMSAITGSSSINHWYHCTQRGWTWRWFSCQTKTSKKNFRNQKFFKFFKCDYIDNMTESSTIILCIMLSMKDAWKPRFTNYTKTSKRDFHIYNLQNTFWNSIWNSSSNFKPKFLSSKITMKNHMSDARLAFNRSTERKIRTYEQYCQSMLKGLKQ